MKASELQLGDWLMMPGQPPWHLEAIEPGADGRVTVTWRLADPWAPAGADDKRGSYAPGDEISYVVRLAPGDKPDYDASGAVEWEHLQRVDEERSRDDLGAVLGVASPGLKVELAQARERGADIVHTVVRAGDHDWLVVVVDGVEIARLDTRQLPRLSNM